MRKPKLCIENLKKSREKLGWSKNYASEEMGILQSAYFRYESGENSPSYSVIKNMALTLGTPVDYLIGKVDDDSPTERIVSCRDPRLNYIIEAFSNSTEDDKDRFYKYAKKLASHK